MNLWTRLSNLLFAPACAACDARLNSATAAMCETCQLSLCELGAACPRCAEPLSGANSVTCKRCHDTPPAFETIVAPYRYGGQLAQALRLLKYRNRPDIARSLAPLVGPMLRAAAAECDVIIPLPLHRKRHLARGFNQSALLASHAMPHSHIDQLSLRRHRATPAQSELSAIERATNVAGAFVVPSWRRKHVADRVVLLVDDVVTTGATMNAAAAALRDAGAAVVVGFCAARAEF